MNKSLIIIVLMALLASCSEQKPDKTNAKQDTTAIRTEIIEPAEEGLPTIVIKKEWDKYFQDFEDGCFALADPKTNTVYFNDKELCYKQTSPASTFKIMNTLVGLETGILKDENTVLDFPKNSTIQEWNKEHTLATAYKNSVVPYYQALAKKIGIATMNKYVMEMDYGNKDITGGIDLFWLVGNLRISPIGQLDFLTRVYYRQPTFSEHSYDVLNRIMVYKKTDNYTIKAKTGLTQNKTGWWVGWIETKDNVYFFANLIKFKDISKDKLEKRIDIALEIMKNMQIIKD